jgi:hypothetical protein
MTQVGARSKFAGAKWFCLFVRLFLLTLIRRDRRGIDAVSDTRHYAADDEMRQGRVAAVWGALDDGADDHNEAAGNDGASAAKLVADNEDEYGAHQAADLVDGGHQALDRAVVPGLLDHVGEGRRRDDAAHDALVVAEEQEPGRADGRYRQR